MCNCLVGDDLGKLGCRKMMRKSCSFSCKISCQMKCSYLVDEDHSSLILILSWS
jgi:hypothetical protein